MSYFINASRGREFTYIEEDKIGNETVTVLSKGRGEYLEKSEAIELIKQLASSYNLVEIEKLIEFRNKEMLLLNKGFDFATQGPFVRCNSQVYKFKEFNRKTKTNRVRKMTCDFCGKHFTSETDNGYYKFSDYFMQHEDILENLSEEACSEFCIQKIWLEALNEWLKREDLLDFVKDYVKI